MSAHLCDVTLRDGEQGVDAAFTVEDKVRIATRLDEVGIPQVQVGFPRPDGAEVTKRLKGASLGIAVELLCVAFTKDWRASIDAAVDAGADVVQILMRASDNLLERSGMSRDEAMARTDEAVRYAREVTSGVVTYGTSFSTHAEPAFLQKLVTTAATAGADRVVVCDSLGRATPSRIGGLVRSVRSWASLPVGIHCHNDYGLAVACTLAGLEAGATWADVSVTGIGERSGNASLEQVAVALRDLCGWDEGIRTEGLCELAQLVATTLRRPIPPDQPVIGDNSFAQKLDIHVKVSSVRPDLIEPYDPASVGNRRRLRLGKGSGVHAVRMKLEELAVSVPDDLEAVVAQVAQLAEQQKRHVDDDQLRRIVADGSSPRRRS